MSYPIEFIEIKDVNNIADSSGYGSIDYNYSISKYLITNSQIIKYLNEIKDNFFNKDDCYDNRCGIGWDKKSFFVKKNFEEKPIAFINPRCAKTFCNYIYNLENNLNLNSCSCYDVNFNKINNYGYFIPNKNEWYKAAYFNGLNYNLYPIKNNLEPLYVQTKGDEVINQGPNTCNFSNAYDYQSYHGFTSRVGECGSSSHYGVYDMAGNLYEFIEDSAFFIAGGSWHSFRYVMKNKNSFIEYNPKTEFGSTLGLRIVKL
jgi:hypothetical protein